MCVSKITSVLVKFLNVHRTLIYGSRALGTYKNGSDIDLVLVGPSLTTTDLLKIENLLDDLVLPYKIELILHHQIENADLIEHITRVGLEFKV